MNPSQENTSNRIIINDDIFLRLGTEKDINFLVKSLYGDSYSVIHTKGSNKYNWVIINKEIIIGNAFAKPVNNEKHIGGFILKSEFEVVDLEAIAEKFIASVVENTTKRILKLYMETPQETVGKSIVRFRSASIKILDSEHESESFVSQLDRNYTLSIRDNNSTPEATWSQKVTSESESINSMDKPLL